MEKTKRTSPFSARNLSFVVLAIAIAVSGYLSYLKLTEAPSVCIEGGVFDCETVLNSVYSELGGIPIAWWGLGLNLIILAVLILEPRVPFLQENGILIVFALVLFAFLYSVYLVYVQAMLIRAYCPWCLSHEALITVLFGLSTWRLVQMFRNPEAA